MALRANQSARRQAAAATGWRGDISCGNLGAVPSPPGGTARRGSSTDRAASPRSAGVAVRAMRVEAKGTRMDSVGFVTSLSPQRALSRNDAAVTEQGEGQPVRVLALSDGKSPWRRWPRSTPRSGEPDHQGPARGGNKKKERKPAMGMYNPTVIYALLAAALCPLWGLVVLWCVGLLRWTTRGIGRVGRHVSGLAGCMARPRIRDRGRRPPGIATCFQRRPITPLSIPRLFRRTGQAKVRRVAPDGPACPGVG